MPGNAPAPGASALPPPVVLAEEVAEAWPGLPRVVLPLAVYLLDSGQRVVIGERGEVDPWPPHGHRSVASVAGAGRGA